MTLAMSWISFACYQGVGGEYPAASTSASEAANEQMVSKRGPGWFLDLAPLAASDPVHVVFVMVTNFVLTVSCPPSLFMDQPQFLLSIARWSYGFFCIPHRSFNCRRESSFHGLAYLLRLWGIPSAYGTGPPVEDAQLQALPQRRYQE